MARIHRALPTGRRFRAMCCNPTGSTALCARAEKAIQTTPLTSRRDSAVVVVTTSLPPCGSALVATRERLLE